MRTWQSDSASNAGSSSAVSSARASSSRRSPRRSRLVESCWSRHRSSSRMSPGASSMARAAARARRRISWYCSGRLLGRKYNPAKRWAIPHSAPLFEAGVNREPAFQRRSFPDGEGRSGQLSSARRWARLTRRGSTSGWSQRVTESRTGTSSSVAATAEGGAGRRVGRTAGVTDRRSRWKSENRLALRIDGYRGFQGPPLALWRCCCQAGIAWYRLRTARLPAPVSCMSTAESLPVSGRGRLALQHFP